SPFRAANAANRGTICHVQVNPNTGAWIDARLRIIISGELQIAEAYVVDRLAMSHDDVRIMWAMQGSIQVKSDRVRCRSHRTADNLTDLDGPILRQEGRLRRCIVNKEVVSYGKGLRRERSRVVDHNE